MIYWFSRRVMRAIFFHTMRVRKLGVSVAKRPGGYLLACTHVSHLDPFCLACILPRKIGWMARLEFYQRRWASVMLGLVHAFPVNRQGVAVRAVKESLRRLARGEVVGIFPEGELREKLDSAMRGGAIKRGVCLLAARSGKPVLPCVIIGTDKLNAIGPWLPFKRGRLWVACGEFIEPVTGPDRRAARAEMARQIEQSFVELYARLRKEYGLEDSILP